MTASDREAMLAQERAGIVEVIMENPDELTLERIPLVDNGHGQMVENPYGVPVQYTIIGRISHESRIPLKPEAVPAGLGTNMSRFLLVDWETIIYNEDEIVNYLGKRWRIGLIDALLAFGEIIGYQAPIMIAENIRGT
ncbi:MAG: hypothetical protein ACM34O_10925 [Ignavibacteria bacterium]